MLNNCAIKDHKYHLLLKIRPPGVKCLRTKNFVFYSKTSSLEYIHTWLLVSHSGTKLPNTVEHFTSIVSCKSCGVPYNAVLYCSHWGLKNVHFKISNSSIPAQKLYTYVNPWQTELTGLIAQRAILMCASLAAPDCILNYEYRNEYKGEQLMTCFNWKIGIELQLKANGRWKETQFTPQL